MHKNADVNNKCLITHKKRPTPYNTTRNYCSPLKIIKGIMFIKLDKRILIIFHERTCNITAPICGVNFNLPTYKLYGALHVSSIFHQKRAAACCILRADFCSNPSYSVGNVAYISLRVTYRCSYIFNCRNRQVFLDYYRRRFACNRCRYYRRTGAVAAVKTKRKRRIGISSRYRFRRIGTRVTRASQFCTKLLLSVRFDEYIC